MSVARKFGTKENSVMACIGDYVFAYTFEANSKPGRKPLQHKPPRMLIVEETSWHGDQLFGVGKTKKAKNRYYSTSATEVFKSKEECLESYRDEILAVMERDEVAHKRQQERFREMIVKAREDK